MDIQRSQSADQPNEKLGVVPGMGWGNMWARAENSMCDCNSKQRP